MAGRGSVLGNRAQRYRAGCRRQMSDEMGGYDSLEQLQQVWDTRYPNDSAPMTYKDANDADA